MCLHGPCPNRTGGSAWLPGRKRPTNQPATGPPDSAAGGRKEPRTWLGRWRADRPACKNGPLPSINASNQSSGEGSVTRKGRLTSAHTLGIVVCRLKRETKSDSCYTAEYGSLLPPLLYAVIMQQNHTGPRARSPGEQRIRTKHLPVSSLNMLYTREIGLPTCQADCDTQQHT